MTFSVVPYPPPPPATHGPPDNPGRQPTFVQTLGMIAAVVLVVAIACAVTVGSSTVVLTCAAAGSGLLGGFVLHALIRPRQRSAR